MMGMRGRLLATLVAIGAGLGTTAWGDPAETYGPAFGRNRYATAIRNPSAAAGAADVDDYVSVLRAGEKLSVRVAAARKSELKPRLELIGPDGEPAEVAVKSTRGGRSAALRRFLVPATGRWTVRVTGADGTEGDYLVAFDVQETGPIVLRRQRVGNDQP